MVICSFFLVLFAIENIIFELKTIYEICMYAYVHLRQRVMGNGKWEMGGPNLLTVIYH